MDRPLNEVENGGETSTLGKKRQGGEREDREGGGSGGAEVDG